MSCEIYFRQFGEVMFWHVHFTLNHGSCQTITESGYDVGFTEPVSGKDNNNNVDDIK